MTGRIETYLHSDTTTPNKGGAMVRVISQTDFAARTGEFITFCKNAARFAYAAQTENWEDVINVFPDVEAERIVLAGYLKETITVEDIRLLFV